jgi:2-iminoacetate synthase ThiH
MSGTVDMLKERIFSLQRHKEEAEQVKYELSVSIQRLASENAQIQSKVVGMRQRK